MDFVREGGKNQLLLNYSVESSDFDTYHHSPCYDQYISNSAETAHVAKCHLRKMSLLCERATELQRDDRCLQ